MFLAAAAAAAACVCICMNYTGAPPAPSVTRTPIFSSSASLRGELLPPAAQAAAAAAAAAPHTATTE